MLKKFFEARVAQKTIKTGKKKKNILFFNPSPSRIFIFGLGSSLLLAGTASLLFLYLPLIKAVFNYKFTPKIKETAFQPPTPSPIPTTAPAIPTPTPPPVDYNDFYIFIPKIKASARVYGNINPANKKEYLEILKKGVAHALGSGYPAQNRSIYLFAHSTDAPINIVRYNAVFFLLNELEKNDLIILFFNGKRYKYNVYNKLTIGAKKIEYLNYSENREILILQTCWPPGTTWQRLIIFAEPAPENTGRQSQ